MVKKKQIHILTLIFIGSALGYKNGCTMVTKDES